MPATRPRIDVSRDPEALAGRVALWIADLACHSMGPFAVCLSGGSTPRRVFQLLAEPPLRRVDPWPRRTRAYPGVDSRRSTAFVGAGGDKHAMMQRVVAGERELPATRIRPVGELIWFIDEAAHGGR